MECWHEMDCRWAVGLRQTLRYKFVNTTCWLLVISGFFDTCFIECALVMFHTFGSFADGFYHFCKFVLHIKQLASCWELRHEHTTVWLLTNSPLGAAGAQVHRQEILDANAFEYRMWTWRLYREYGTELNCYELLYCKLSHIRLMSSVRLET